ncbi:anti-sigma-K factor RskA [Georgenia soli]|uniref:Anti-sigma-K factor RskA n=1 Tax=Georgenia soli TaxID=638953 RepID=A0A2A9EJP7_9MICO|nr:anti-sigma factor [Georgenia soli]PFG39128.1 anti-sigma-K factor RskA [Georgenia soli]
MSHLDDETIALRALGEHVGPEVQTHLESCEQCRAEVASLERVTSSARGAGAGRLERPPERVWDGIAEELGLADGGAAEQVTAAPAPFPAAAPPPAAGPPPASAPAPSTATTGASAWRRRTAWIAAASFLVGVGGTVLALNLPDRDSQGPVVASAALDPMPGREATGEAAVHEKDGRRVLDLRLDDAGPTGFLEVWLLDADAQRLVSLGMLTGTSGTFELPPGLDLKEFPVVDVSDEPYDGNPAHSGDSIVRGRLA